MSDDSSDSGVVHQQQFQIRDVVDQERIETAAQHSSSLLIVSITDSRHQKRGTETAADFVINTTRLSPGGLEKEDKESQNIIKKIK